MKTESVEEIETDDDVGNFEMAKWHTQQIYQNLRDTLYLVCPVKWIFKRISLKFNALAARSSCCMTGSTSLPLIRPTPNEQGKNCFLSSETFFQLDSIRFGVCAFSIWRIRSNVNANDRNLEISRCFLKTKCGRKFKCIITLWLHSLKERNVAVNQRMHRIIWSATHNNRYM